MKNDWLFLILIVSILACSEAPQTQNIFKELTKKHPIWTTLLPR